VQPVDQELYGASKAKAELSMGVHARLRHLHDSWCRVLAITHKQAQSGLPHQSTSVIIEATPDPDRGAMFREHTAVLFPLSEDAYAGNLSTPEYF
jgi:hypothetical protein